MDPNHYKKVQEIADKLDYKLRNAFLAAVNRVKSRIKTKELEEAIDSGDLAAIERVIGWDQFGEDLTDDIERYDTEIAEESGNATALATGSKFAMTAGILSVLRDRAKIQALSVLMGSKDAIRDVITTGRNNAVPSGKQSKVIMQNLGLNRQQARSLENYKNGLIANNVPLGKVNQMVEQRSKALIKERAANIAQYEADFSANRGYYEMLKQGKASGMFSGMEMLWSITPDERLCPVCRNYAGEAAPIGGAFSNGYQHPPAHNRCFLPDTRCETPGGLVAGARSWYSGPAIEIIFSSGRRLSVTPNHPIVTVNGFVEAGRLNKGDYVVCSCASNPFTSQISNNNSSISTIRDVFESISKYPSMNTRSMPSTSEDFHGDGRFINGDIDVVFPDSLLLSDIESSGSEHISKDILGIGSELGIIPFSCDSSLTRSFIWLRNALGSDVSSRDQVVSSGLIKLLPPQKHGFRSSSGCNSNLFESANYSRSTTLEVISEFLNRHPGIIETDEIICINIFPYHGYVYDLQSISTFLLANGVLTSNCRCRIRVVRESPVHVVRLPDTDVIPVRRPRRNTTLSPEEPVTIQVGKPYGGEKLPKKPAGKVPVTPKPSIFEAPQPTTGKIDRPTPTKKPVTAKPTPVKVKPVPEKKPVEPEQKPVTPPKRVKKPVDLSEFSAPSQHKYFGGAIEQEMITTKTSFGTTIHVPPGQEAYARMLSRTFEKIPKKLKDQASGLDVTFSNIRSPADKIMNERFKTDTYSIAEVHPRERWMVVWGGDAKSEYGKIYKPNSIGGDHLAHELSHFVDGESHIHSTSQAFIDAHKNDGGKFTTQYAEWSSTHQKSDKMNALSEEFAEAVTAYVWDKEQFTKDFPNKAAYIKGVLEE